MSATLHECECSGIDDECSAVKEYVRYRLDEFPFTTARKISHLRCNVCKGLRGADDNKEFNVDLAKNRTFIQEQDKLYSSDGNLPVIPLKCNASHIESQSDKQWRTGSIKYLRYVHNGEKIDIVPAIHGYLIYCNNENKLSIAARQFVKPDDYFKLVYIA